MEFITVALATFTGIMFVLGILPFRIPAKLMPVATSAAAYGVMELYATLPAYVEAAAVAGGVAIVTRYAVSQLPEPWSPDDLLGRLIEVMPRPKAKPARVLEATRVNLPGRRIPRL